MRGTEHIWCWVVMQVLGRLTRREQETRDRLAGYLVDALPATITPTHLTAARIIAVGVAMVGAAGRLDLAWQLVILGVGAVTDLLDGPLARRRGQTSSLGKVLDQVADLMVGGWLGIMVLARGLLPWNLIGLMLLPELVNTGAKWLNVRRGAFAARSPNVVSRLQFTSVVSGFWLVLLGHHEKWRLVSSLGYSLLYVEVLCSWTLMFVWLRADRNR